MAPFKLPPAVPYVVKHILKLCYPSALLYIPLSVINRRVTDPRPTWFLVVLSLLAIPIIHVGGPRYQYWYEKRRAAQLGAVMPPRWNGRLLGNLDIVKLLTKAYMEGYPCDVLWEKLHEIGWTFDTSLLWAHNYITIDANFIKAVLSTDFNSFAKGENFDEYMRSFLGSGVFNSDGDLWKFHRNMTRPFFVKDRISHFELFDRLADEAIAKMKERMHAGHPVDFQDLISRFTLDSATEFLCGQCVHSLHTILPYPHTYTAPSATSRTARPSSTAEKFALAMADAMQTCANRARLGSLWPWAEIFGDKTAKSNEVIDAFINPLLKAALEKANREKGTARDVDDKTVQEVGENDTLLDSLVKYTRDPVILRDEVVNILIAGRDTTATTLTYAVYFLSQYPAALKRLRKEVLSVVGSTRRPTYDDIKEMKYLRAVLNETMRLYPAVPINIRYSTKDTVVPSSDPNAPPLFVPDGTLIFYSVFMMHRRKDYWGDDAEEFDPDRFIDERLHKYLIPNPFIFLPFNAGPRICLGQQFAYNQMSFVLVRLLQQFESISFEADAQPPSSRPPKEWATWPGRKGIEKIYPKSHLTTFVEGGLWVKFEEAVAPEEP